MPKVESRLTIPNVGADGFEAHHGQAVGFGQLVNVFGVDVGWHGGDGVGVELHDAVVHGCGF